jgi:sugar lactone lactonase YvrE
MRPKIRKRTGLHRAIFAVLAALLLPSCAAHPVAEQYIVGLNQPRGLAFDAAGNLLVAEAGAPDPDASADLPIATNHSARVLRIDANRHVTTLVDHLPFTRYAEQGSDIGAADVALIGGTLYVLTGEGYDPLSRSVLRVAPDGALQPIASIMNFATANALEAHMIGANAAVANPYAMVAAPDGGALFVADGASGRVLRVGLDGKIRVFAELPESPPLTGLTFGPDGKLYFTDFSKLPHSPGSGAVWAADPSGALTRAVGDLTMPIDVGFDTTGRMYVLEFSARARADLAYAASDGRLLRIESDGARTVVLDGLNYPTAMVFSRAGDLFIALNGPFGAIRRGSVLKVACAALGVPAACHA